MSKLTLKFVRAELAKDGVSIAKRDGEYKVRVKGTPISYGYFTLHLEDAYASGRQMAISFRELPKPQ